MRRIIRRRRFKLLSSESDSSRISEGDCRLIDPIDFMLLCLCQTPKSPKELISLVPRNKCVVYDRLKELEQKKFLVNIGSFCPKLLGINYAAAIAPMIQLKLQIKQQPIYLDRLLDQDSHLVRHRMTNWEYWEGDFDIPQSTVARIAFFPRVVRIHLHMPLRNLPTGTWEMAERFLLGHLREVVRFCQQSFPGLKLISGKKFLAKALKGLTPLSFNTQSTRSFSKEEVQEWLVGHARSQTWIFLQRTTFKAAWGVAEQLMRMFNWRQVPFILKCDNLAHPIDISRWSDVQLIRKAKNLGINGFSLPVDNPDDEIWRHFTLDPTDYLPFVSDIGDSAT
jgi:hypothetical protein